MCVDIQNVTTANHLLLLEFENKCQRLYWFR